MSSHTREAGATAIGKAFQHAKQEGRPALITYLTLGYPSPQASLPLVLALEQGGAEIIELGVPFSDPLADGPIIQRASYTALCAGTTPPLCLDLVAQLRQQGLQVPVILMGYYNPILSYGIESYTARCAEVGVAGLIVPDLPLEEAAPLQAACQQVGIALIFLVTPTSNEKRIAQLAAQTEGFLYVVSRLGTTGPQQRPMEELEDYIATIRHYAHTPLALGFGIAKPQQAQALRGLVDGLIVGSALVECASKGPQVLAETVSTFRRALSQTETIK